MKREWIFLGGVYGDIIGEHLKKTNWDKLISISLYRFYTMINIYRHQWNYIYSERKMCGCCWPKSSWRSFHVLQNFCVMENIPVKESKLAWCGSSDNDIIHYSLDKLIMLVWFHCFFFFVNMVSLLFLILNSTLICPFH